MKGHSTPSGRPARGEAPPPGAGARSCPHCAGTGFQPTTGEDAVPRVRRCGCLSEGRADRLLRQARIPRRYQGCSFDSYDAINPSLTLAKRQVRHFVDEYPLHDFGLLLLGTCGVGKTHLASAALQTLIREKGVRGLFYDFRDLLKEIQASYNPVSGTTELAILQPIFAAEVLVLDDLGATKMTDWVRDTLSHIINNRYNDRRVTLFTSNLEDEPSRSPAEERLKDRPSLRDQIGAPLRSRLYEMCEVIRLEGEDFRLAVKHTGRRRPGGA
ncbi:MAG TPA: ATP-binding protein [Candidatus Polarisedimenticolia bacterium]|nr:ATP-binding protein [Candidatus Polarisedimenticolia bacterium]